MQATQLLLVLLGASVAAAHFTKNGNFCDDEKKRYSSCKPLVSHEGCGCSSGGGGSSNSSGSGSGVGSGSGGWEISGSGSGSGNETLETSGSGSGSGNSSGGWEISGSGSGSGTGGWQEGEYCFLLQIFLQFSVKLEVNLQNIFVQWINRTQVEIVQNPALTEYEILVQLWYSLEILFGQYYEIEVAVKYQYIGEWGYVCDLEGLVIEIQSVTTTVTIQDVVASNGTNGTCPFTAALSACGQNSSSTDQAAIQVLVEEITVIIEGGLSFAEILVQIYIKISAFIVQYPHLEVVIYSGQIEGFGIIQSYIDICAVYWRIENFGLAVGGSTSNCSLIASLYALFNNQSLSLSQRSDFKELHDKIVTYFEANIEVEIRLQYFVEQFYQLLILAEWDINVTYIVEIQGYGSIYYLIYAYVYCQNHGLHPGNFTTTPLPTTTPIANTTFENTTVANTTVVTSTLPTTTTPKPSGNCSTVYSVNYYNITTSITILVSSIDQDQADASRNWTKTEKNQFVGYRTRILNYSKDTSLTQAQIYANIRQIFISFTGTLYARLQAVYIINWGTVAQYCSCSA